MKRVSIFVLLAVITSMFLASRYSGIHINSPITGFHSVKAGSSTVLQVRLCKILDDISRYKSSNN